MWSYKCCDLKELNGEKSCARMCEPEIKCQGQDDNDVEVFEENTEQNAQISLRGACRSGFKFYNGRCRRVLGQAWNNI